MSTFTVTTSTTLPPFAFVGWPSFNTNPDGSPGCEFVIRYLDAARSQVVQLPLHLTVQVLGELMNNRLHTRAYTLITAGNSNTLECLRALTVDERKQVVSTGVNLQHGSFRKLHMKLCVALLCMDATSARIIDQLKQLGINTRGLTAPLSVHQNMLEYILRLEAEDVLPRSAGDTARNNLREKIAETLCTFAQETTQ